MIEIPRSLVRHLRAVLRRCFRRPRGVLQMAVEFHVDSNGLRVRAADYEVAVEYRLPDARPAATLVVPLDALAAWEGRGEEAVTLESGGDDSVLARWQDAGVPQAVAYEAPPQKSWPEFPTIPEVFVANPAILLTALGEAARTAAPESMRQAIDRVLLRGQTGDVAATDSKQLLIWNGFQFGWADAVLVPAVSALGGPGLDSEAPVDVGRTADHVVLRTGPWTVALRIDSDGHFPDIDTVVPQPTDARTYCRLAPSDATFLAGALPRLPGAADEGQPVTLDLNGTTCVRARAAGQAHTTEVVLALSGCGSVPARLCLQRQHLARALKLGLADLYVVKPTAPLLFRDDQRTYIVMPLDPKGAVPPTADALRIESQASERPLRVSQPERTPTVMNTPSTNGHENGEALAPIADATETPDKASISIGALITESQALRDAARELYGRAGRLVTAIQRHRRQSRLVATTLASLRQLQQIGG